MFELLLIAGLGVAVFVGFNIGGSSTGVAFGPAVGSGLVSKVAAATLMTGFALLGAWTAGRGVIQTLGGRIVPSSELTLGVSVIVLFFVGLALLISNTFGVPASTSMTAVGALAGLGVATDTLQAAFMAEIVGWWLVSPVIAFWICAVIGRYLYPYLDARFGVDQAVGPLVQWQDGRPRFAPDGTRRQLVSSVLVVTIACYMAFAAGASNAANAVGPLVGSPQANLSLSAGIAVAIGSIGFGAFTIARRTMDTVGSGLTDLPLLAALIVEVVSASIITLLSWIDIPASLAVSATMCIVGLGWGRATRTATVSDAVRGDVPDVSVDALAADSEAVPELGGDDDELLANDLFDPGTTGRVMFLWILTPSVSFTLSYLVFLLFVP